MTKRRLHFVTHLFKRYLESHNITKIVKQSRIILSNNIQFAIFKLYSDLLKSFEFKTIKKLFVHFRVIKREKS
jgi:hypothetical protein